MKRINIVAVQFRAEPLQIQKNTQKVEIIIKKIKKAYPKVELIIFPEMSLFGYGYLEKMHEKKRQEDMREAIQVMKTLAKGYQVHIIIGYFTVKRNKYYNTLGIFHKNGKLAGEYNKIHLVKNLDNVFTSGTEPMICHVNGVRLGIMICWDCAFAELGYIYGKNEVDALIIAAAWEKPFEQQWEVMVQARAIELGKPVIAVNRAGTDENLSFVGKSFVANEEGFIVEKIGKKSQLYYTLVKQEMDVAFGLPYKMASKVKGSVAEIKL